MKTAKPSQAESGTASSRRAQPVRQTRVNPTRVTSTSRNPGGRDPPEGNSHDQPIDIFPAITHFTDAITSLPKDLVRHFTLLKEVDAKIFAPEEHLFQLVDAALKSGPPKARIANDSSSAIAAVSTPTSTHNSISGPALSGNLPFGMIMDENYNSRAFDPDSLFRRQVIRQTCYKLQEMLVSLEEKNHVIATANDAISKHHARINDVWPHLEAEFSDEAKWGSTTHWAYPENRLNRANQAEKSRRDGAATITAAAQQLADEAAARSDARKQAIIAKKGLKNQHQDSDVDEHEQKQKSESTKKASNKSRKTTEAPAPIGLGITTSAAVPNGNPPPKRRKVENNKSAEGGQPMERAMSSVMGNNASKAKNSSPRATPAPEPPKKRKALPTVNGLSKKSKTALAAVANSPSITSSPVQPTFAENKTISRASPAPSTNVSRPTSSRARQNSINSGLENGRHRPASSASNRTNGVPIAGSEIIPTNGSRPISDSKAFKEPASNLKTEVSRDEVTHLVARSGSASGSSKKEVAAKTETLENKGDAAPVHAINTITTTIVTTKSGRASKPSTPALGSFPDHPQRSRSSRNSTTTVTKRPSHKKGASQSAIVARLADEDANSSAQGDDEGDVDADEPLYCYCNGVSYGEMVACDADDCAREWFHLDCVGLKAAPPSNQKWYCDNCKERLKNGKKINGR